MFVCLNILVQVLSINCAEFESRASGGDYPLFELKDGNTFRFVKKCSKGFLCSISKGETICAIPKDQNTQSSYNLTLQHDTLFQVVSKATEYNVRWSSCGWFDIFPYQKGLFLNGGAVYTKEKFRARVLDGNMSVLDCKGNIAVSSKSLCFIEIFEGYGYLQGTGVLFSYYDNLPVVSHLPAYCDMKLWEIPLKSCPYFTLVDNSVPLVVRKLGSVDPADDDPKTSGDVERRRRRPGVDRDEARKDKTLEVQLQKSNDKLEEKAVPEKMKISEKVSMSKVSTMPDKIEQGKTRNYIWDLDENKAKELIAQEKEKAKEQKSEWCTSAIEQNRRQLERMCQKDDKRSSFCRLRGSIRRTFSKSRDCVVQKPETEEMPVPTEEKAEKMLKVLSYVDFAEEKIDDTQDPVKTSDTVEKPDEKKDCQTEPCLKDEVKKEQNSNVDD